MSKIPLMIFSIASLIVALAGAYYIYELVNLQRSTIRNEAIQQCLDISTYTVESTESGVTTVEPIESVYRKCLELKNI